MKEDYVLITFWI